MCREVSKDTMASEILEAHDPLETMEIPTEPRMTYPRTDEQGRRNQLQKIWATNRTTIWQPEVIQNSALTLVWRLSKEDNVSLLFTTKDRAEWYIYAESIRCLVTIRELKQEDEFVRIQKLAQSWTFMFVIMKIVTVLKCRSDLCFKTEPPLGFEFWLELKSTWKRRQKPLKTKSIELQGNLLPKQNLEWNQQ